MKIWKKKFHVSFQISLMHVMAWQQQTMIWTDGDLFHWRKYALSDMCVGF